MKRTSLALSLALALAVVTVFATQHLHDPGSAIASPPVADRAQQLRQGEYLVRAGNCMGCHTSSGGKELAGGRAIQTPFGVIVAPNITPDRKHGIGTWSADDFWRAIHNGKSKDGRFLYPAFPYPSYTKIQRADADAMYAYLMGRPAVDQANAAHELAFPFNQRPLLAFWRALYFTPGEYQRETTQTELWNRGVYLVQGAGHCAACHTARDAWGGPRSGMELGGGELPGSRWYAGALDGHRQSGLGAVSLDELATLLKTGVSERKAVAGPMADVVRSSLQYLSAEDALAMATYLKTVPAGSKTPYAETRYLPADNKAVLERGTRIYAQHCAACHREQGQGHAGVYPALAGNGARATDAPTNAIQLVLNGGFAPATAGNPRPFGMPPFGQTLDDEEVAAVLSVVRTSWGNQGTMVSPVSVNRLRGVP